MGCVICQNPPFIFVHVPKTGGTSFLSDKSPATREIAAACEGFKLMNGHLTAKFLSRKYDFSKYFSFAMVRNPYDRLIKLWQTKCGKVDMSLDTYIRGVSNKRLRTPSVLPQSYWLTDGNDLLVNKVLRYENYNEAIRELLISLNLPTPRLPHLRKDSYQYSYHYYFKTQKQIDFATNFYAEDLERFGYEY